MLKKVVALIFCAALASCSTPGVPSTAGVELNPIDGPIRHWRRNVEHGCVNWSATENWAMVELSVDSTRCEGAPGLSYHTSADYLAFRNYGPQTDLADLVTQDSNGRISFAPCSFSLSADQLETLRTVAREGLARSSTDAERRTLTRIDHLLAATNGAALTSDQQGCTGRFNPGANIVREDAWTNTGEAVVPCEALPATAVTTVPAPFDQYMQLTCTRSGQALRPVDGAQWLFSTGPRWMWSVGSPRGSAADHFVRLTPTSIDAAELASLRGQLAQAFFPQTDGQSTRRPISDRTIIGLSARKSAGSLLQIYLLIPPPGASDQRVLGVECARNCRTLEGDAMYFVIVPD